MQVTLNSRTLIGAAHEQAEAFARNFFQQDPPSIDWLESPSARCVLKLPSGHTGDDTRLEQELRRHLGMPAYAGDDASESERLP